jgi:glycosyltransferase involved in cell wall biosynthesis
MMRVLHCIHSLDLGGSQRQLALLSRELTRHGWDVHIATLSGGCFEHTLDPATALHLVAHRGERDVRVPLRIARLIDRLQPALVHTWLLKMDILAGLAVLARGVPWIASERSSAAGYPPHWSTRVRPWLVRRADALVANSAGGLEMWQNGRGPGTLRLIRNGFDLTSAPLDSRLPDGVHIADDAAVIVYAGRLVVEKRLRSLLQACVLVRSRVPAVVLMLCGTGPLEAELRQRARELGLDDVVVFPGFVRDMEAVLRRASVFVSLSEAEGSPNAVQEAMACGTPVVLSDIPAHRELASADAACFVDGDDEEAIAAGLIDCARNRLSARARAETAQSLAAGWSADTMGAEYDALYRQVLQARRRWPSRTS